MSSNIKRISAVFLSVFIVFTAMPFTYASAAEEDWSLIGILSSQYESNGNPATISSGSGDAGGASYGAYQFASKVGVPLSFANWCISGGRGVDTGNRLVAAYTADQNTYGETFNAEWIAIAKENSAAFLALQHDYIKANYYDVMINRIKKSFSNFDVNKYSIALKNVIWSRSVQHGAYSNIIINAFNNVGGFNNQSEDVLINAIYEESGAVISTGTIPMKGSAAAALGLEDKYMKYFSNNSSSVQISVYKRLRINELNDALEMYYTYLLEHIDGSISRLAGNSRVQTAIEICKAGWLKSGCSTVIIANGYSFADALAGGPVSYALNAPILLTANKAAGIEKEVLMCIDSLKATNVVILGGEGAVSKIIEEQFTAAGLTVERIFGSTRFDTAVAIADKLYAITGSYSKKAFITYGYNYPDALAVSSVAAITGTPILFAGNGGSLDSSTADYISEAGVTNATILGGEGAVGRGAEAKLTSLGVASVNRIFGTSRYDTAFKIICTYDDIFTGNDIALATGASFPDALAGGAFAAKMGIPVILVSNGDAPLGMSDYVVEKQYDKLYAFGGTGALSDSAIINYLS